MAKEKCFLELIPAVFDSDGVQVSSSLGNDGKEYPDPVPMAPPVGYTSPPNIMDLIRSMVRNQEVLRLQDEAGIDTFEEADDFDIEDDPLDPLTPYERVFEAPPARDGVGANGGPPVGQQPTAPVELSKPDVSADRKTEGSGYSGNKDSKLGSSLAVPQSDSQSQG